MSIPVVFFGSFLQYSASVLEQLVQDPTVTVKAVVTTPPRPAGRQQKLQPTHVHQLAQQKNIPVLTPDRLNAVSLAELAQVSGSQVLLLTAGYGKLLPPTWLSFPQLGALNLHFSLLPAYRGANPAEWALLMGAGETGVTLIEMSPTFDTGQMVAQASLALTTNDTRETVYRQLYDLGGQILPTVIGQYLSFKKYRSAPAPQLPPTVKMWLPPVPQSDSPTPYAKRLQRDDGYIGWAAWQAAQRGQHPPLGELSPQLQQIARSTYSSLKDSVPVEFLERATRALAGFPGVWTLIPTNKGETRMKILSVTLEENYLQLEEVHVAGQQPAHWNQIKTVLKENT